MKRNRIVINLDPNQPRTGGKSKSRGGLGRLLLVFALLLILVAGGVAAGGFFWWRHYQNSPAYSLALLADAAQRNDTATVDKILDTDKISADIISQLRQRAPGSSIVSSLLPGQVDPLAPTISTKIKESVHAEAIRESQRITEVAAGKPFVVVALAIPWYADIKQETNTAHATVNIKDEQIELTMQADGERWRIIAVKDENLTKTLANTAMRNLQR